MTEAKARSSNMTQSVEKFEFKWSNVKPSRVNEASLSSVSPEGYSYEAVIAAPSSPEISIPEHSEDSMSSETITDDSYPTVESYSPPSVDIYPTVDESSFRSSPKSSRKLSLPSFPSIPRAMRLRLLAVGGWSGVAGLGAGVLLTSAGSAATLKVGILGGVWGAVAVSVWLLIGKLNR